MSDSFSFRIPRPPNKKNNMISRNGGLRPTIATEVVKAQHHIGLMARENAKRAEFQHRGEPLIVTLEWDGVTDRVDVKVEKVAAFVPSPRRFDLQNILDIVLDAMQKAEVVRNDKDFVSVTVKEKGAKQKE